MAVNLDKYFGSCHCGAVQFEIMTKLDRAIECNCSYCSKKAMLYHRVEPENFTLLSGEDYLTLYQFDTKEASHYFCRNCGIHTFTRPRANPRLYSVNLRCLTGVDLQHPVFQIDKFDGKNWEQTIKTFR